MAERHGGDPYPLYSCMATYTEAPQPRWQLVLRAAYGMARDGSGTRRAAHSLVRQSGQDRLALEAARDQLVTVMVDADEPDARRALCLVEAALRLGDRRSRWPRLQRGPRR